MSKARSPRFVLSMTVGMRFSMVGIRMNVITPLSERSGTDRGVSSLTLGERSLADQPADPAVEKYPGGYDCRWRKVTSTRGSVSLRSTPANSRSRRFRRDCLGWRHYV